MQYKVILMVEDNPDDEELTRRALKKSGVANQLVMARDGAEALDYLYGTGAYQDRDISQQPAVVILDIKLPRLDGFEVLKRIRNDERTKYLPVVILTSSKEDNDLINGYGLGANSYVRKPVIFEEFARAIHQLGLYWLVINEPLPGGRG